MDLPLSVNKMLGRTSYRIELTTTAGSMCNSVFKALKGRIV
jgi:hypothetical protein